jgi:hypothetical protein
MYESYSKRDFDIFWSGCCYITKFSSFHHFLYYKCITLAILRHKHETHFWLHSMHKVWIKRNSRDIQNSGSKASYASYTFYDTLKDNFVCSFTNTVNFLLIDTFYILWSVFHACASRLLMGCTYKKENGKRSWIWLYNNNQTKICQSLFWNMIHTYRTRGYQQYLHFYQLEHLLWLNHILPTLLFRNMALAGHMGKLLKFWLQILNLLEIWAQMIYGSSHMGSPYSRVRTLKMAVSRATGQICRYPLQILNLLIKYNI